HVTLLPHYTSPSLHGTATTAFYTLSLHDALPIYLIYSIRAMLLAMPGRLAVDLAATTKPSEVSDKIKGEVYNVLAQITNYQYDPDRKSTRLNSSHVSISYAVFCLKQKNSSRQYPI